MAPSLQPSLEPSLQPSRSIEPSSIPSATLMWVNITSFEQYTDLPGTAKTLDIGDDGVTSIVLGFDYSWFGKTFTEVCLSSNGQINMGKTCDSSKEMYPIGSYGGARIALVQEDLYPPGGGAVKYLVKSSPPSLKVSFEDVKFHDWSVVGGIGNIQAQVELFANGDIIFCYGDGDMGSPFNYFAAGVEDNSCHDVAYPIPDPSFNDAGITNEWPANICWKFNMPAECTSTVAPSVSSNPSHIPTVSFNVTYPHLIHAKLLSF